MSPHKKLVWSNNYLRIQFWGISSFQVLYVKPSLNVDDEEQEDKFRISVDEDGLYNR